MLLDSQIQVENSGIGITKDDFEKLGSLSFFRTDQDFENKAERSLFKKLLSRLPDDYKNTPLYVEARNQFLKANEASTSYKLHKGFPWHLDMNSGHANFGEKRDLLLFLANADFCPTQFLLGEIDLGYEQYAIFEEQTHKITKSIEEGKLVKFDAPNDTFIRFNTQTIHMGNIAKVTDRRLFVRILKLKDYPHYWTL